MAVYDSMAPTWLFVRTSRVPASFTRTKRYIDSIEDSDNPRGLCLSALLRVCYVAIED